MVSARQKDRVKNRVQVEMGLNEIKGYHYRLPYYTGRQRVRYLVHTREACFCQRQQQHTFALLSAAATGRFDPPYVTIRPTATWRFDPKWDV